jgi:hypothetical protein
MDTFVDTGTFENGIDDRPVVLDLQPEPQQMPRVLRRILIGIARM